MPANPDVGKDFDVDAATVILLRVRGWAVVVFED